MQIEFRIIYIGLEYIAMTNGGYNILSINNQIKNSKLHFGSNIFISSRLYQNFNNTISLASRLSFQSRMVVVIMVT